eukprot:2016410-Pleurochrysis_carterae.AAC.1
MHASTHVHLLTHTLRKLSSHAFSGVRFFNPRSRDTAIVLSLQARAARSDARTLAACTAT